MYELHHVGILVKDITSECANFVHRLGYVIESELIDDPVQTARVQFLRQPGANHWVELITPDSEASKLSNALHKGGGLHHFCYEVKDIERAIEVLAADGMMLVGKPVGAAAFPGRRIAWLMGSNRILVELLEAGTGTLSLYSLKQK